MDPYYLILFFGFGLIFGIPGTAIASAARFLPVDRRVAGIGVIALGCVAKYSYGLRMPPTPGIPIPLITSIAGFLIHPLFFAGGVLVISGLSRYRPCLKTKTVFPALFFTGGIIAVLGAMEFYRALYPGADGPGAPDFALLPSLIIGLFEICLAAVIFMAACEAYLLLQKRSGRQAAETLGQDMGESQHKVIGEHGSRALCRTRTHHRNRPARFPALHIGCVALRLALRLIDTDDAGAEAPVPCPRHDAPFHRPGRDQ